MPKPTITIRVQYVGSFGDDAGLKGETIETTAETPLDLFEEVRKSRPLKLGCGYMRIVINGQMAEWQDRLKSGDEVAFYPPVGGG